jgi:hypothetical protein
MEREIVPLTDWVTQLGAINRLLSKRQQYRMRGRPCPTPLTNVREIVTTLRHIEPLLKRQANEELTAQALSVMEEIVTTHSDIVSRKTHKHSALAPLREGRHIPQTPAEQVLQRVYDLAYLAKDDARLQSETEGKLHVAGHCGTECPYPDLCRRTAERRHSWYRMECPLYRLSLVIPADGWRKAVGFKWQQPDNQSLQRSFRGSYYYRPTHDSCLSCIARPGNIFQKGCYYHQGRKCLIAQEAADWMAEQQGKGG